MLPINTYSTVISDIALSTALGNDAKSVANLILKKNSAAIANEHITAIGKNDCLVPVITAPMHDLQYLQPQDRIIELFLKTIDPLLLKLPKNFDFSRLLFYVLLPSRNAYRRQWISPEIFHKHLTLRFGHQFVGIDKCTIQGHESHSDCSVHFNLVSEILSQENNKSAWDMVILGAVDSLIHLETIEEYITLGNIRKQGDPSGEMPGEGAAFLLLQREHAVPTEKLVVKLQNTLNYLEKPKLDMIVTDRLCATHTEIEWYERSKKRWSGISPPEIRTQRWLGNLGAAHGPLMFALACGILTGLITEEHAAPIVGIFESAHQDSVYKHHQVLLIGRLIRQESTHLHLP